MTWPFGDLKPRHYRVILVDPPWRFQSGPSRNPINHYPCMKLKDIAALPVKELAHPDGARLLAWTTPPFLAKTLDMVRKEWGFRYSTTRTWGKLWPKEDEIFMYMDSLARGTGYEAIGNQEFLIIAKIGKPERLGNKKPMGLFFARRREHSRKPDILRDEYVSLLQGPRCELFARSQNENYESWGNETTKFREAA